MDFFNSSADLTLALLSFSQQEDLCQGSEVSRSCDVAQAEAWEGTNTSVPPGRLPRCSREGLLCSMIYFVCLVLQENFDPMTFTVSCLLDFWE